MRNVYLDILHVGNAIEARDLKLLYDHRIEAVVDLAINEKPSQLAREMIYCRFPLNDGGGNSAETIDLALRTICNLVRGQYRTLVACSAGMSRSPCFAAAAVSLLRGDDPDSCLVGLVQGGPSDISPVLWSNVRQSCLQLRSGPYSGLYSGQGPNPKSTKS